MTANSGFSALTNPTARPDNSLLDRLAGGGETLALFLDFDGTLVDIAPTPAEVVAPPGLPGLLARLAAGLDGALAVLSGRQIADIDLRLRPFLGRAAGVHGAELRLDPEGEVQKSGGLAPSVLACVRNLTAADPRLLIEYKRESVAIHYRGAEDAETGLGFTLEAFVAAAPEGLLLLRGRKVFEIMRSHVSKGEAVMRFLEAAPFAGRRPVMIGDDRTDVTAMDACVARGGYGFRVASELFPATEADFSGPEAVRAWLADFAERLASQQESVE
jgi:trehalose 6-phosphate phosphatase